MNKLFIIILISLSFCANSYAVTFDTEGDMTVEMEEIHTIYAQVFDGNITVDGGTLNIFQTSTVNGKIIVLNGGTLDVRQNSTINGKVRVIHGSLISIAQSEVTGEMRILRAERVDIGGFVDDTKFNAAVKIEGTDIVNIIGVTFLNHIRVSNVRFASISSSNVAMDVRVQEATANVTVLSMTIQGTLRLIENASTALGGLNIITGDIIASDNNILGLFENQVGGDIRAEGNIQTTVRGNQVQGDLKLILAWPVCDDTGNIVAGKIKGGCDLVTKTTIVE